MSGIGRFLSFRFDKKDNSNNELQNSVTENEELSLSSNKDSSSPPNPVAASPMLKRYQSERAVGSPSSATREPSTLPSSPSSIQKLMSMKSFRGGGEPQKSFKKSQPYRNGDVRTDS